MDAGGAGARSRATPAPRAWAASSAPLPGISLPHAFLCKVGPSFQDPEPAPQPDGHPLPLQRILSPPSSWSCRHGPKPPCGARCRPPRPPWSPWEARQAGHVCASQAGEVKEPQDRQVLVHQRKWKTSNPLSGRRAERRAERRQGGFRPGRRLRSRWSKHRGRGGGTPALGVPGRGSPRVRACGKLIKAAGSKLEGRAGWPERRVGEGERALRAPLQHGLPRSAMSGDSGDHRAEGRVGSLLHLAKSSAVN